LPHLSFCHWQNVEVRHQQVWPVGTTRQCWLMTVMSEHSFAIELMTFSFPADSPSTFR